jgi:hypothetical protein
MRIVKMNTCRYIGTLVTHVSTLSKRGAEEPSSTRIERGSLGDEQVSSVSAIHWQPLFSMREGGVATFTGHPYRVRC